jgi:hypothetical protein
MYAARPYIQEMTDKPLNDKYFTQVLLPDYIAENGVDWDVVFDNCGHFEEPHTDTAIGVGTVRAGIFGSAPSSGPDPGDPGPVVARARDAVQPVVVRFPRNWP